MPSVEKRFFRTKRISGPAAPLRLHHSARVVECKPGGGGMLIPREKERKRLVNGWRPEARFGQPALLVTNAPGERHSPHSQRDVLTTDIELANSSVAKVKPQVHDPVAVVKSGITTNTSSSKTHSLGPRGCGNSTLQRHGRNEFYGLRRGPSLI